MRVDLLQQAMSEVEAVEAAVSPKFECGVYSRRIVLDGPIVASRVSEAILLPFHYENIEPTPWFRIVPPTTPIPKERDGQPGS